MKKLLSNCVMDASALEMDVLEYEDFEHAYIEYVAKNSEGYAQLTCTFETLIGAVNHLIEHEAYAICIHGVPNPKFTVMVDTDPEGQYEDAGRETVFEVAVYDTYRDARKECNRRNSANPSHEYFVRIDD